MANKKGRKPTNNKSSVKINNNLNEKLNNYCGVTGSKKTEVVNTLLNDFFKNKILTNDYITINKPFYFNKNDLIKNRFVNATTDKPIKDLINNNLVNKIPNNLDTFNNDFKSYCYEDNLNKHRGLYFNFNLVYDLKTEEKSTNLTKNPIKIDYDYYIFDYDIKKNALNIGRICYNDIALYIDDYKQRKLILSNFKREKNTIESLLNNNSFWNNLTIEYDSEIIEDGKRQILEYNILNKKELDSLLTINNKIQSVLFYLNDSSIIKDVVTDIKFKRELKENKKIYNNDNLFYLDVCILSLMVNNIDITKIKPLMEYNFNNAILNNGASLESIINKF